MSRGIGARGIRRRMGFDMGNGTWGRGSACLAGLIGSLDGTIRKTRGACA